MRKVTHRGINEHSPTHLHTVRSDRLSSPSLSIMLRGVMETHLFSERERLGLLGNITSGRAGIDRTKIDGLRNRTGLELVMFSTPPPPLL